MAHFTVKRLIAGAFALALALTFALSAAARENRAAMAIGFMG